MDGRAGRKMPPRQEHCAYCGAKISHPRRAYCSTACQRAAQKQSYRLATRETREMELSDDVENVDSGEIWMPVDGYEDEYAVSNYGRVKSVGFFRKTVDGKQYPVKPRLLKQQERNGYLHVAFAKNGVFKRFRVHRLVAQAFISNPEGKPHVNHIDGNKSNNMARNLEWVTASENTAHAIRSGLIDVEESRIGVQKAQANRRKRVIRDDGKSFQSVTEAAKDAGVSASLICHHIKTGTPLRGSTHLYSYGEPV